MAICIVMVKIVFGQFNQAIKGIRMQRIELNIELWPPLATAHGSIRLAVDTLYLVCDNLLLCVSLSVVIVVVVFSLQLQLRLQCQPNLRMRGSGA